MKSIFIQGIFISSILGALTLSQAQTQENPVDQLDYYASLDNGLAAKYMSYVSEVAHGQHARKMEKRRADLISSIRQAIHEGGVHRPYKGDTQLRDAFLEYWNILLSVFNEDYKKIVDMEEIAEQSYDGMEAYLMAREKANERLNEAYAKIPVVYDAFAEAHHITITSGAQSALSKKLEQTSAVNRYVNRLYLIFFKSTKQEIYMLDALNNNNINGLEQNRATLSNFATEGLLQLDSIQPFKGDGSLANACRKVLIFQKAESEKSVPTQSEYLLKKDEFEKYKKTYDATPASKHSKTDVDNYNSLIAELNSSAGVFNKTSEQLNANRNKVMSDWDSTYKRFTDQHIPYK